MLKLVEHLIKLCYIFTSSKQKQDVHYDSYNDFNIVTLFDYHYKSEHNCITYKFIKDVVSDEHNNVNINNIVLCLFILIVCIYFNSKIILNIKDCERV